ncbi:MAG: MaoC/PaaZ C-terminal domain-containing protein [Nannocystaceae bacterium]
MTAPHKPAQEMPSLAASLARLVRAGARKPGLRGAESIPRIEAYATVAPDRQRLAAFRDVCAAPPGPHAPLTWPYALVTPLHLHIVSAREFPLPALGLVHMREQIVQTRPIPADAELCLRCRVDGHRPHRRGVEFDLTTEVSLAPGGAAIWRSTTTALARDRDRRRGAAPLPAATGTIAGERWSVTEDTGRRYARVSRNFDPIHLHRLTSRWFGFRRPIVHGMWTVGRCVAALHADAAPPVRLDVRFRSPLFLPAEVVFAVRGEPGRRSFAVCPAWGGRPHLEGELVRL